MAWLKTSLVTRFFFPPPLTWNGNRVLQSTNENKMYTHPLHHSNKKTSSKEGYDWLKFGLN